MRGESGQTSLYIADFASGDANSLGGLGTLQKKGNTKGNTTRHAHDTAPRLRPCFSSDSQVCLLWTQRHAETRKEKCKDAVVF